MKTEFVDVNETRKNRARRNPERRRRRRDRSRRARLLAQGARSPASGPARRRRASSSSASRIRSCTTSRTISIPRAVDDALRETGRGGGRHAGRPRRDGRGRAAADLHRVVRHGAGVRARRSTRRSRCTRAVDARRRRGGATWRCSGCATARARYEPVEGRGVDRRRHRRRSISSAATPSGTTDTHKDVSIELGAKANPPGFDEQLLGLEVGATKTFTIHYPADYPIGELANTDVSYTVTVKGIKRRVLPELDDEFAKDLGEFETLDALRARVREDLEHEARARGRARGARRADEAAGGARAVRGAGVAGRARDRSAPRGLRAAADRPERRSAPGGHRLERVPREPARGRRAKRWPARWCSTRSTRREQLEVTDAEVEQEVARYAERTGRTPAAVRAALEKEGGLVAYLRGVAAGEVD